MICGETQIPKRFQDKRYVRAFSDLCYGPQQDINCDNLHNDIGSGQFHMPLFANGPKLVKEEQSAPSLVTLEFQSLFSHFGASVLVECSKTS